MFHNSYSLITHEKYCFMNIRNQPYHSSRTCFNKSEHVEKLTTLCSTNITAVWIECKAGIKKPNPLPPPPPKKKKKKKKNSNYLINL